MMDFLWPAHDVELHGVIGSAIDRCVERRVMAQDHDELVQPFRDHVDGARWFRGEFWGKWLVSAVQAYSYRPTKEYRDKIDRAVEALLSTQAPDGLITTYDPAQQLRYWDVWVRKYVLLGLIAYHDATQNDRALDAACRVLDQLIEEIGKQEVRLPDLGLEVLKGLATNSLLEPVAMLAKRTGEARYRAFAEWVVACWSEPSVFLPRGLRLIEDAIAGVPPARIASPKAYEMMSCYEGLCELYRVTENPQYLEASLRFAEGIRRYELMVNGSGSNWELWDSGSTGQTEPLELPQETCVTVTWMKLCYQLLRLTGDPSWADGLEVSLYNALLGAMVPDGSWWGYFSPLIGYRSPSKAQFSDVNMSCCVASGPRGLLLTPSWAVMSAKSGPVVNLYGSGSATVSKNSGDETVTVIQETEYPLNGSVRLRVLSGERSTTTLRLRIPAWSRATRLFVNGEAVECRSGSYAAISRVWDPTDEVLLELDLRGRAVPAPSGAPSYAVMRGPVLLAMDDRLSHFSDAFVRLATNSEGHVDLVAGEVPEYVQMVFNVPFEVKPTNFFDHKVVSVAMCDFASAGNDWSESNQYRSWFPQPLYKGLTWPDPLTGDSMD